MQPGAMGALYVVATPLGNLEDMTARAVRVLKEADLIAAEDTRHSAPLLRHFGIATPMISLHEHNERDRVPSCIELLERGKSIALISDAGTPLISDPGFRLVSSAAAAGAPVVAVPGPCAAIAAMSIAALPSDRFTFEGFPPARQTARRSFYSSLAHEPRTLVFYESAHRILDSVADMAQAFGAERQAVVARELTKTHETVYRGTLAELGPRLAQRAENQLGEFVIVLHGAEASAGEGAGSERVLRLLLAELPLKRAVALAAEITGQPRNALYRQALTIKEGATE